MTAKRYGFGPKFFCGLHQPSDGKHFRRACISVNRLADRKKPVGAGEVFLDSGAFTILATHGEYPDAPEAYAALVHRLVTDGVVRPVAVATQDYMCEPFMLAKTGKSLVEHQVLTVQRYDAILAALLLAFGVSDQRHLPFEFVPVLQGWAPTDYVNHIEMYGARLHAGMWVGVGSVCKRQGDIKGIRGVLLAIKRRRRDLRLHGFGVKKSALVNRKVRRLLDSADSMAWSYAARKQGRNANCWTQAAEFADEIERLAA